MFGKGEHVGVLVHFGVTIVMSTTRKERIRRIGELLPRIALTCASFFFLAPQYFLKPFAYDGRDPHWQRALYHAFSNDWVFGRDIVFTYGPLGFLDARYGVEGFKAAFLVTDLLLYLGIAVVLITFAKRLGNLREMLFLTFACFCIGAYGTPLKLDLMGFGLFVFFALSFLFSGNSVSLLVASLLTLFLFAFKVSIGLPVTILFATVVAVNAVFSDGPLRKKWLASLALYGASFLVLCYFLNIDILGYIRGSLSFVSSYSEVMNIEFKDHRCDRLDGFDRCDGRGPRRGRG